MSTNAASLDPEGNAFSSCGSRRVNHGAWWKLRPHNWLGEERQVTSKNETCMSTSGLWRAKHERDKDGRCIFCSNTVATSELKLGDRLG